MSEILTAMTGQVQTDEIYDAIMKENHDNRILIINQDISDCLVEDCMLHILSWNRDDKDIPKELRKPIKIYFNSQGGDVMISAALISLIEESVTPIWGVNIGLAASAAYQIYLSCHRRISLKNGIFLQHDGSVSVSTSGNKARNVMDFFNSLDELFKTHVLGRTTMDEAFYDKMYDQEFWFMAEQGKDLGVVDEIVGVDVPLTEIL